jgi:hypothetical protein
LTRKAYITQTNINKNKKWKKHFSTILKKNNIKKVIQILILRSKKLMSLKKLNTQQFLPLLLRAWKILEK